MEAGLGASGGALTYRTPHHRPRGTRRRQDRQGDRRQDREAHHYNSNSLK